MAQRANYVLQSAAFKPLRDSRGLFCTLSDIRKRRFLHLNGISDSHKFFFQHNLGVQTVINWDAKVNLTFPSSIPDNSPIEELAGYKTEERRMFDIAVLHLGIPEGEANRSWNHPIILNSGLKMLVRDLEVLEYLDNNPRNASFEAPWLMVFDSLKSIEIYEKLNPQLMVPRDYIFELSKRTSPYYYSQFGLTKDDVFAIVPMTPKSFSKHHTVDHIDSVVLLLEFWFTAHYNTIPLKVAYNPANYREADDKAAMESIGKLLKEFFGQELKESSYISQANKQYGPTFNVHYGMPDHEVVHRLKIFPSLDVPFGQILAIP